MKRRKVRFMRGRVWYAVRGREVVGLDVSRVETFFSGWLGEMVRIKGGIYGALED